MKVIDLESHFYTEEYIKYLRSRKDFPREEVRQSNIWLWMGPNLRVPRSFPLEEKLLDMGPKRIEEMDAAGVNIQVLSLCLPGVEQFDAADGAAMARQTNDELAGVIKKYPDRYVGLAALAPQNPAEAAKELERSVKKLKLKGAKLNSHVRGEYLDDQKYWVLFEAAEKPRCPSLSSSGPPFAFYSKALCGLRLPSRRSSIRVWS